MATETGATGTGGAETTPGRPRLSWGVRSGTPIEFPGGRLTPRALHASVRWGEAGIIFWNWPVGATVQQGDAVRDLPIVDLTRWALWGMTALALLTGTAAVRSRLSRGARA